MKRLLSLMIAALTSLGLTFPNWGQSTPQDPTISTEVTEATEATEHVHEWVEVVTEPTCTATGYTTYTCEMCGYSYQGNEVEAKGHQYTETVKEASCTEKGYTTHTCAVCGDTYDDAYTDALGHDFGDWITTKEATCDDNGEETRRCSRCDAYETNEVAKLGHDYGAVITAPNCTKAGFTTHTCSRCADAYVDSHTAALGHSWGKWTTVLAPTEEAAGSAERKCSACGEVETKVLDKLEHVHAYAEVVTPPTCTEDGYTTFTCKCGDTYTGNPVKAVGHDYDAVVTDPTCTEKGHTTYACKVCGDTYVGDEVDALGHDFSEWEVSKEASCTDDGVETRTCKRHGCNAEENRPIEAEGHHYVPSVTAPTCTEAGFTTYTCSECMDTYTSDETAPKGHIWDEWVTVVEPTEEAAGSAERKCSVCGDVETKVLNKLEHVHAYTETVTPPTCTEDGYTTFICKCGDTYTSNEVGALGHDFSEWQVTQKATCTEDGVETRTCKRDGCNAEENRPIEAAGHHYVPSVTAPTCTEAGFTTYTCSECMDAYTSDETAPKGHTWDEWVTVVEPTEETAGSAERKCSSCGEVETKDLEKLDHVHVYTETVTPPTCTEDGYTTFTCKCGDSYTGNTVQATGHDYTVVITDPTCTEEGYTTHTCKNCGDSYITDKLAAKGHRYVSKVIPATCTEAGRIARTCSVCGDENDTPISATGHTWGEWQVTKEATTEAEGEQMRTCSACGATETQSIDKKPSTETTPAQSIYDLVNEARAEAGLSPLEYYAEGQAVADLRAAEIRTTYGHTRPDGSSCFTAGPELGIRYFFCGENIASGYRTEATVFRAWMNSSGHRANILSEDFTHIAVANNGAYWAMEFFIAEDDCSHIYVRTVTEPTCTEGGYTTYTCKYCGDIFISDEVKAAGHQYNAVVTEPTCTENGFTTHTCEVCGDSYTSDEVDATGHSYTAVNTVAPSCTEQGYTVYQCSACGDTQNDDSVPATEHTWVHHHEEEQGHYVSGIECQCGWYYSGTDEIQAFNAHIDEVKASNPDDTENHTYSSKETWVVDIPEKEWDECSVCGAIK